MHYTVLDTSVFCSVLGRQEYYYFFLASCAKIPSSIPTRKSYECFFPRWPYYKMISITENFNQANKNSYRDH